MGTGLTMRLEFLNSGGWRTFPDLGGCRTSDSAMHHSLTSLIGSESPVTRFNVPKLRGDNEMDVSETDDIILSPVSSPAHTASTIEHDLAEQHEHPALLSCEYITLQRDR